MTRQQLVDAANDMVTRMHKRRVPAGGMPIPIDEVSLVQEGNFTIVVLNGRYTGVAKFNPRDVVVHTVQDRNGNLFEVEKSKFSPVAGTLKAMHRAAEKLFA